jgi:lactate racemase
MVKSGSRSTDGSMRIEFPYDRDGLAVDLPDRNVRQVLRLRPIPALPDVKKTLLQAMRSPLDSPPLLELARGRKDACVVVSDVTRPVPNRAILPSLLQEIENAGVQPERIIILVGTGLHRPSTAAELSEILGQDICQRYRIEHHAGRDTAAHEYLGDTPRGTPVWVDRRYTESDLKIVTGLVEPHLMAGYSGGRKAICPGLCAIDTIKVWHGPRFLESELATTGVLEGNRVHEEATAIAALAGCDYAVNVVLNSQRQPTALYGGDLSSVFASAVRAYDDIGAIAVPEPADIVVTSAAGHPLDTTWYQSIKGLVGALPAVRKGGEIIMAAGCREGIGGEEFTRLCLETSDLQEFARRLHQPGTFTLDQWQLEELAKVARHANVSLVTSGLNAALVRRLHAGSFPTVEEAVANAVSRYGNEASIIAIPEGPYVLPRPN